MSATPRRAGLGGSSNSPRMTHQAVIAIEERAQHQYRLAPHRANEPLSSTFSYNVPRCSIYYLHDPVATTNTLERVRKQGANDTSVHAPSRVEVPARSRR